MEAATEEAPDPPPKRLRLSPRKPNGTDIIVLVAFVVDPPSRSPAYISHHIEALLEILGEVGDVRVAYHLQEVEDDQRLALAEARTGVVSAMRPFDPPTPPPQFPDFLDDVRPDPGQVMSPSKAYHQQGLQGGFQQKMGVWAARCQEALQCSSSSKPCRCLGGGPRHCEAGPSCSS